MKVRIDIAHNFGPASELLVPDAVPLVSYKGPCRAGQILEFVVAQRPKLLAFLNTTPDVPFADPLTQGLILWLGDTTFPFVPIQIPLATTALLPLPACTKVRVTNPSTVDQPLILFVF